MKGSDPNLITWLLIAVALGIIFLVLASVVYGGFNPGSIGNWTEAFFPR